HEVRRSAISSGAYDDFVENGSMEELRLVRRRASQYQEAQRDLARLRASAPDMSRFAAIVGTDETMRAVCALASKVASADATVLITGESGTGKELLAQAIHRASTRADQPFDAVACS